MNTYKEQEELYIALKKEATCAAHFADGSADDLAVKAHDALVVLMAMEKPSLINDLIELIENGLKELKNGVDSNTMGVEHAHTYCHAREAMTRQLELARKLRDKEKG